MSETLADIVKKIKQVRASGRVERCHTVPHSGSYNIAAHSWGVAMLLKILYPSDFPKLVLYALTHDIAERLTGDIPSPFLVFSAEVRRAEHRLMERYQMFLGLPCTSELNEDEAQKLRTCDHLELFFWAHEQSAAGNSFAEEIIASLHVYWKVHPLPEFASHLVELFEVTGAIPDRPDQLLAQMNFLEI